MRSFVASVFQTLAADIEWDPKAKDKEGNLGAWVDLPAHFQMKDLRTRAFQRYLGFSSKTSATDLVAAASALLEHRDHFTVHGTEAAKSKLQQLAPAARAGAIDVGRDPPASPQEAQTEGGEAAPWVDSFWKAYDCVLGKDSKVRN